MDEGELRVVIRPFDPSTDVPMVYSTWRNSAYYSAAIQPEKDNDLYFKLLTKKIASILGKATVRIACLESSPNVIIGYSVSTGKHLDWVYVKGDYRNRGIGRILVPKDIETVTPNVTKTGLAIVQKKKLVIKGDSNG